MRGSLSDFALPEVLQVVGVSRQHTVIEVRTPEGKRCGAIAMKAGQVLSCEHGGMQGLSAFFQLFERSPGLFHVFRLPDRSSYPQPLGALTKLLFEAATQERQPKPRLVARTSPPTRAKGSVVGAQPGAHPGTPAVPHVVRRRPTSSQPPPIPRAPSSGKRRVVIGVASPKGGVGKTTISLNLSLSLAESGLDVAIVDADVNGDLLSAVNARDKAKRGAFDLLDTPDDAAASLCATATPRLRILPACGGSSVPIAALQRPDLTDAWKRLIGSISRSNDVTLVDCPAGMFHTTQEVLRSCTHVIGVFQAEILSSRSFSMFLRGLGAIEPEHRPNLAGVVVNMFHGRATGSIEAFHHICSDGERHRLFDTTIPRSDAFGRATMIGQPLRSAGDGATPIAFLFDMLADELCHRVGVRQTHDTQPNAFIV